MSETLRVLARCLWSRRGDPDLHVVAGGSAPLEEMIEETPARPQPSEVVEDPEGLRAHPVSTDDRSSGFTHFLDGKQESHLVLYCGHVPVVYAVTGAVVRARDASGVMHTSDQERDEGLYAALDLLPPSLRSDLLSAGISLHDAPLPASETITIPALLREARNAVSAHRAGLEQKLAGRWVDRHPATGEAVLMVDGGLRDILQVVEHPQVLGVVKSCSTPYFGMEEQMRCYRLRTGERSSVFLTPKGQRTSVHSWYLRLFDHRGSDLTFGLVRLEAARSSDFARRADQVSRWMLAERAPLSKPDPRWDRMTYTIFDCEQYLRSVMPSRQVIAGRLALLRG